MLIKIAFTFLVITTVCMGKASAEPFAYVANRISDNVSVIDVSTNTVVDTIVVGIGPVSVTVNRDGERVFVANLTSQTVTSIQTPKNEIIDHVALSFTPLAVAANPLVKNVAYVVGGSFSLVSIEEVIDTFEITGSAIAVRPDGEFIYLADGGAIIIVKPSLKIESVAIDADPVSLAVTTDGDLLYVGTATGRVFVLSTSDNKVVDQFVVGIPWNIAGIAVSPDGDFVYASNSLSNEVAVIDTSDNSVVDTVTVGFGPRGIAVTSEGDYVYVANQDSNDVSVIDTSDNSVVDTVDVGESPVSIAISSSTELGATMNGTSSCALASTSAVKVSFPVYLLIPAFILIARLRRTRAS